MPIGIGGFGSNNASDSNGTVQVGGGNTAAGSLGSVQSAGPSATPAVTTGGTQTLFETPPVGGSGDNGSTGSGTSIASLLTPPAGTAAAPGVVQSQGLRGTAPVATQGLAGRSSAGGTARSLLRSVVAGGLPFTGIDLLLWVLIGCAALAAGAALRRRRVTLA
jgi:hypothetical protein